MGDTSWHYFKSSIRVHACEWQRRRSGVNCAAIWAEIGYWDYRNYVVQVCAEALLKQVLGGVTLAVIRTGSKKDRKRRRTCENWARHSMKLLIYERTRKRTNQQFNRGGSSTECPRNYLPELKRREVS